MSLLKRINTSSKANNDTGFGAGASGYGGRFINKDGSYNLRKEGIPFLRRFSIYQTLLHLPRWKFIIVLLLFFLGANLLFTMLYLALGVSDFQGVIGHTRWQQFKELYFFSTETFTTVGYGRVNPIGDGVNLVAALEAMMGFLSFAIATGLFYGRFSKPQSHLIFSDHALVGPFQDKTALMFRIASFKDRHNITNAEVIVTVALLQQNEKGATEYKFYTLPLERPRVDTLMMNWTVVHPIDGQSPLLGLLEEDYKTADVEIYVHVKGYDDVYASQVLQRTSYTYDEIRFNARFVPMYRESEDGRTTILELHKLNTFEHM
ncbi:ion channel [Taibaiella koreensis]|uniref:ion channel n=1 Tax=Taibaiella koreensis TaxID=1268548 RepID=UPI000E59E288|nr:ion channel [Taibaiella koreensis]